MCSVSLTKELYKRDTNFTRELEIMAAREKKIREMQALQSLELLGTKQVVHIEEVEGTSSGGTDHHNSTNSDDDDDDNAAHHHPLLA
jgi:hypothetical protein